MKGIFTFSSKEKELGLKNHPLISSQKTDWRQNSNPLESSIALNKSEEGTKQKGIIQWFQTLLRKGWG